MLMQYIMTPSSKTTYEKNIKKKEMVTLWCLKNYIFMERLSRAVITPFAAI